jgi:hypothetical protein
MSRLKLRPTKLPSTLRLAFAGSGQEAATRRAIREKEGAASSAPTESWYSNTRLRWPTEKNQKSRRDAGATKGGARAVHGILLRQGTSGSRKREQAPALQRNVAMLNLEIGGREN